MLNAIRWGVVLLECNTVAAIHFLLKLSDVRALHSCVF